MTEGKVSLPRHTPEQMRAALQRLIKGEHSLHIPPQSDDEDFVIAGAIDELVEARAALEEAQQQLAEEKKWRAVEHEVAGGYHRELVEAQQTIARQTNIFNMINSLSYINNDAYSAIKAYVNLALGNKEGEKTDDH
ncbi:hypothetical protein [Paenibacillus rhizophilus]|uniref:Uncharacterized protein n=1 Tax=Paenibacillus rhizophilus TaxID=1850366 RepID=A0A3N9P190_9BACL|nr:hypothetical protein [Paenibacillus rhizophilus]RQW09948.1 hypothetical protein EH198_17880 [Paenibacillus rhizophilus]